MEHMSQSTSLIEAVVPIGQRGAPTLTVVVPCYNEEEVFPFLKAGLAGIADVLCGEFRV